MGEAAVAQRIQSAAERADPQSARGVFLERPDLVAGKPVGRREEPLVPAWLVTRDAPESFAIGAGPDGSIAAFAQRGHHIDQQEPAGRGVAELFAMEHAEPAR